MYNIDFRTWQASINQAEMLTGVLVFLSTTLLSIEQMLHREIDIIFLTIRFGTRKQKAVQVVFVSKNIPYWKK